MLAVREAVLAVREAVLAVREAVLAVREAVLAVREAITRRTGGHYSPYGCRVLVVRASCSPYGRRVLAVREAACSPYGTSSSRRSSYDGRLARRGAADGRRLCGHPRCAVADGGLPPTATDV
ncbi:hypothetical protein [Streptomyces sp. NPDC057336]|uniref:hypothetical protein n=1 Tax=Streptomyces sp. NPDC057336 TaxID=3346102 RepID=UPI00362930C3